MVLGFASALPAIVALYFIVSGFNKDIDFASDELRGIAYIRPLDKLLRLLPEQMRISNKGTRDARSREIDAVMEDLKLYPKGYRTSVPVEKSKRAI